MPNTTDSVSANVRAEMARRGLSQTDVAAILGVSQVSVSARLRGKVAWRIDDLTALARHFGMPVADLLDDSLGGAA
ncbi:MAG: helix-turn-helix domain-containing protein [Motilibacteraceae bacterium]